MKIQNSCLYSSLINERQIGTFRPRNRGPSHFLIFVPNDNPEMEESGILRPFHKKHKNGSKIFWIQIFCTRSGEFLRKFMIFGHKKNQDFGRIMKCVTLFQRFFWKNSSVFKMPCQPNLSDFWETFIYQFFMFCS